MQRATASIGIDLGGTNTKIGLLVGDALHHVSSFPTHSHRPREDVLEDVLEAVARVRTAAERDELGVTSIGVGVPATLDQSKSCTLVMPNFAGGWFGFALSEYLERETGVRTSLINDARAFALAESTFGEGQSYQDVFGIVVGTGVGGGLVLSGRLHFGKGGLAGEIGHHIVEPRGARCGCGSVGCLETVASAPALVASVTRPYLHGRSPVLFALTGGDLNAVSAENVAHAARAGDPSCQEAFAHVGFYLGIVTANIVTLLAPQCTVFGGGLSGASDLLFPVIRKTWQQHLKVAGDCLPDLKVAKLEQPGVVGAALYAAQRKGEVNA